MLTAVEVGPPPDTLTTDSPVRLLTIMSFSAQSMPSIRAEKDQFVAFEILTETRLHLFATPYYGRCGISWFVPFRILLLQKENSSVYCYHGAINPWITETVPPNMLAVEQVRGIAAL